MPVQNAGMTDPGDAAFATDEPSSQSVRGWSRRGLLTALGVGVLGAGGLGAAAVGLGPWTRRPAAGPTASGATTATTVRAATFLATDVMHTLSLTVDRGAYTAMLAGYRADGTKGWLKADLTLDGTSYPGVGIRLKGNSSLKGVSDASTAETLPWLVRLDKYSSGVNHQGMRELVVRSNTSKTALNEAVALDLLTISGLASQQAAMLRFTVNGSPEVLRLAGRTRPMSGWRGCSRSTACSTRRTPTATTPTAAPTPRRTPTPSTSRRAMTTSGP